MGLVHVDMEQGGRFMKKSIGILCFLMVAVLVFAGCESKSIDVRGTVTALNPADNQASSFYGCTYTNEYFGFKCDLSSDWEISNINPRPDEAIALWAQKSDAQLSIHVYNQFGSFNTIGKSGKEISKVFADGVLKFYLDNKVVPSGEFSDIELECLGGKHMGLLLQAENGPTPRTSAVLTVNKDGYFVLFQVHYLRSASIEEVQDFFVNMIIDHPSVAA